MLKVGDPFPNVTLQGTTGGETNTYQTAEKNGKSKVFVFFPFAFTAN